MAGMIAPPRISAPPSHEAATAFTTVSARKALGQSGGSAKHSHPVAPARPAEAVSSAKQVWPESVRAYVRRCFDEDNLIPGVTSEEMQSKLKQTINDAVAAGKLGTWDWANLDLPQQMIVMERAHAAKQVPLITPLRDSFAAIKVHDTAVTTTNNTINKKRKSSEITKEDEPMADAAQTSPWRQVKSHNVLEDRITAPAPTKAQKKAEKRQRLAAFNAESIKSDFDLERRKQRFDSGRSAYPSPPAFSPRDGTPARDEPEGPIVGTCQEIEKRYFRLTAPPKPATVRPLEVLRTTYDMLKKRWKKDYNYAYTCDQLKSLRQDLTVQHIKNSFTVDVYELHARIALEKGDLGEYNQCQTQLRALYKQGLGGHPAEFLAYRILYFIYTCNRTDMNDVLADLTAADRQQPAVRHALEVRSALASGNYHRFFKLFYDTPNMGMYLIDMFIVRERVAALAAISRAYKPDIPLRVLSDELGFETDQECAAFICDHNGEALLEANPSGVTFAAGKAGNLFEQQKVALFRRVDIKGQI